MRYRLPKRTAIIAGAGIGGLATAMRLAARGDFSVTILEKNETVGGRCNVLVDQGFRFDTGPSLLLMTDVYRELFSYCGMDFDERVPLIKIDPNYRVHFADNTTLEMSGDLSKMIPELEKIEPGSASGYYRFLEDSSRKYRIGRQEFVEKNFTRAGEFFTGANLKRLGELNALDKLYSHVSRYFKDERLRQAFSMQSMYLGISPYEAPAVYTLLAYTELAEDGLYFPKGGLYALPAAMEQACRELGVTIETNCNVRRIEVESGKATGVMTDAGFRPADIVISNVDLPHTYTDLLSERPAAYAEESWKRQKFTSSAFMLYLGLDCVCPDILHHNFYLSEDYRGNFEDIFNAKTAPRNPSFYVNAPGRTDPSVAPPGCDNLFVLVPIPHLTDQQRWNPEQVSHFRERIYNRLEERVFPQLRKHVVVEHIVTPHDWQEKYNLKYGAAFGLSHGITQVGYFRPSNKSPDVDGLYFVGASTVPGTGVPLVCIGAKLVVERIVGS